MDIKEAARLVLEKINSLSNEEFSKLYFEAQGENCRWSKRYFLIRDLEMQTQTIKDLEYDIAQMQEDLVLVNLDLNNTKQKLKQSFNCR